ncbi:MAG: prenyltransferase/squalene oxidase repeat-containing protein, partial [Planctomycetota bacterium]
MRTVSHTALAWTAALSALGAAAASGQAPAPDPDGTTEEIYRQPQQPLDPRIDPQQVTEYDPPPLAQQVVLPVPPEFRIAAQADRVPVSADHFARARQAIDAGLAYLRSTQGSTGGWLTEVRIGPTDQPDQPSPIAVAVTALAVKAMIQADPPTVEDVRFQLALRFVRSGRRDDGAFEGGALTNYVTSMVVMALATIDRHDFHDELADASAWL